MAKKVLNDKNIKDTKASTSDVEVFGNGDLFRLIGKVSSKKGKWMKSTKAMEIDGVGCVIQVTTQQGKNVAEALTFVPMCRIGEDSDGNLKLVYAQGAH